MKPQPCWITYYPLDNSLNIYLLLCDKRLSSSNFKNRKMLRAREWICPSLSHLKLTWDVAKMSNHLFSWKTVICLFYLSICWNCQHFYSSGGTTPSVQRRLHMKTNSCKVPFKHLQSTDWYLFETWTHSTKKRYKKSTFKSKHIWTSQKDKKKSGNSQLLLSYLLFLLLFLTLHLIIVHSKSLPINLKWITHSLHFGGRGAGVRVCQPTPHVETLRLSPPKTAVCVLYILFIIDRWSNTLLIKRQRL